MRWHKKLFSDDRITEKNLQYNIIHENSRKLIWILTFLSAALFFLFALNVFGIARDDAAIEVSLLTALLLSVSFMFALIICTEKTKESKKTVVMIIAIAILYAVTLIYGCYFTIYMFRIGRNTYSIFYVAALVISSAHFKRIYTGSAVILFAYVGLNIYLYTNSYFDEFFLYDILESFIVVLIIGFINSINTRQYIKSFLKTIKIEHMNTKLLSMSESDPLTGIYNRRKALREIEEQVEYFKRYGGTFCVAMLDIDKFKRINDKFGHSSGDGVLKEITDVIGSNLRENDMLARWGGEEFIIVIPNSDKDSAYNLIDRIRKIVNAHDFGEVGEVTFSAGVCQHTSEYTVDSIIDKADFALYLSKQLGRNKVSIFKAA